MAFASGSSPSGKTFIVKWNAQSPTISPAFYKYLQEDTFTDVTLACQGNTIKCHKIVLYCFSPYFVMELMEDPTVHPIHVIEGVTFSALRKIIDYMYKGEAEMERHELSDFIQAAQKLKVKGLVEEQSGVE